MPTPLLSFPQSNFLSQNHLSQIFFHPHPSNSFSYTEMSPPPSPNGTILPLSTLSSTSTIQDFPASIPPTLPFPPLPIPHNPIPSLPIPTYVPITMDSIHQVMDPKQKVEETPSHKLILMPTLINPRRESVVKMQPVDLRNLAMLSALCLGMEKGLTLTSASPLTVQYRDLAMHACHHTLTGRDLLAAMDGSLVALCTADLSQAYREKEEMPLVFDEMPVCDCLGLGLVRSVDETLGLLHLVTFLPWSRLAKVNTLLKGSLALPDQIILKQKCVDTSPLPYVDTLANSTGVTCNRPRTRMPRAAHKGGKN